MTADDRSWLDRAACAALDPHEADVLFFGTHTGAGQRFKPGAVGAAKRVCRGCPVWFECGLAALAVPADHDEHGIRAGMTPEERATLRRRPHEHRSGTPCMWVGGHPGGERPGRVRRHGSAA